MTANDPNRNGANSVTPLPSLTALDAYFLEARSKLLDLAAILDRVDRGTGTAIKEDVRLTRIRQALEVLGDAREDRAERIQRIFSLEYDPQWERPRPH